MNKFSERLQQALDYRNMKPIELAEKTGIGKSSISDWLKGKYEAKQDKILLIAEALDINEGFLLGLDVPLLPAHSNLTEVYKQLNKTRQAKVYSFAKQQLAEQTNTVVKIPSREEMTLAAHAADPNQLFTEEEINKIHDYLDELDAKYEGKSMSRKKNE